MQRTFATATMFLFGILLATSATGYWVSEDQLCCDNRGNTPVSDVCQQIAEQRAQNNLWPQQYLDTDRCRAKSPFDTMVRNGWRRQNLVGEHHFNDDSTRLTESGRLRIQWIMTQAPPQYRQVYVERSLKEGYTDRRIQLAQEFAMQIAGNQADPVVQDTHLISDGRPAAVVDYVNTQFQENMPIPQLPELSGNGLTEE